MVNARAPAVRFVEVAALSGHFCQIQTGLPVLQERSGYPLNLLSTGEIMKKILTLAAFSLVASLPCAYAAEDAHDIETVHQNIIESIRTLEKVRLAKQFDAQGHGLKAEQLLREAEKELMQSFEATKKK
jgi:hypothetical protein